MELLFAEVIACKVRFRVPFVCQQCGKCCRNLAKVAVDPVKNIVYLDNPELIKYVDVEKVLSELRKKDINHPVLIPCPFLENNKCKIYPIRPETCRKFPLTEDEDLGIGCPALNRLKIIIDEIVKHLGCNKNFVTVNYCFKSEGEELKKIRISKEVFSAFFSLNVTDEEVRLFLQLNEISK